MSINVCGMYFLKYYWKKCNHDNAMAMGIIFLKFILQSKKFRSTLSVSIDTKI